MRCPECILTYRSIEKFREQWTSFAERNTFCFSLAFLHNIETIFRNYIRGCITSIPPKNKWLSLMKGKINLRCKVTARRKVFILTHPKPTPLKFISMIFRIFYNSQNLKEITLKVFHFYKSTFTSFVLQSLHAHHYYSKITFYTTCFEAIYFAQLLIKKHTILSFFH